MESVRVCTRPRSPPVADTGAVAHRLRLRAGRSDVIAGLLEELALLRQKSAGARAQRWIKPRARAEGPRAWQVAPMARSLLTRWRHRAPLKLCRLDLLRYGHMSDVTLAFRRTFGCMWCTAPMKPGSPRLWRPLPTRYSDSAIMPTSIFCTVRHTFEVGFHAGRAIAAKENFVRRKGRRDTLRDMAVRSLPDPAALSRGDQSHDLFEQGFGLDGARHRRRPGLLRLGGEAGESLLAAPAWSIFALC